jgi:hypothetical protein
MREIRPYGSEGGEDEPNRLSLPLFLPRRDSLAVRQRYPASQEKPQSYKSTLRYNDNDTLLRGPASSGENTDQRGPELTG